MLYTCSTTMQKVVWKFSFETSWFNLIFWTHFVTETLVLQTPRNWSQRRRNQWPLTRQNTPPPPKARLGRRPRKTKRRRRTRKASERRVLKNGPVQEPPKLLPAATQCRWFLHHREPPPQCRTSMPSGKTWCDSLLIFTMVCSQGRLMLIPHLYLCGTLV